MKAPTSEEAKQMMTLFFRTSLLLISLFASVNVCAEIADRSKPIELEADTLTIDDAKKINTYKGNVMLTQGTLVIRAAKLIVRQDSDGFKSSTSIGRPTTFKQKLEGKNVYISGSGRRIEYDARVDKVELFTKAWVKRGNDIIYGDYISYDANAEYVEVLGGKKSESAGPSSGRVKVIIQPKTKAASPANAAPNVPSSN